MTSETFSAIALPRSCSATEDRHVSVFMAPRLVPGHVDADGVARGRLDEFALFPHWATLLSTDATIELSDQSGIIDAVARLAPIDPTAWDAAFPPDTPVTARGVPQWSKRTWRSFDARAVHDLGKAVHMATMYADPTSPPTPADHPLAEAITALTTGCWVDDPNDHLHRGEDRGHRKIYDESVATTELDLLLEDGDVAQLAAAGGRQRWLLQAALELHRARRFYERPESEQTYHEHPTPGKKSPPLDRPEPEFHERCTTAGDHPALLRAFGLAVDLEVADPNRLRSSTWLSARISLAGDATACRTNQTLCRAIGDALVTVPSGDEWQNGLARLGDDQRFAMLDLEADGTALKLDRFLWTLPRLITIVDDDAPANAATPALRASGFTVVRTGQSADTQARLDRQHDLDTLVGQGKTPTLSTEDVTRGLRVEVWDDQAGHWRSLHSRRTDIDVVGHTGVLVDSPEEGHIQGTAAHETPGVVDSPIHVHEAVFGWEGWSLSAPRPGRRVRHQDGDEVFEDTPTTTADPIHPFIIRNRVEPGSLPKLRFGHAYALRAWAVDLAGNVRPHELDPAAVASPDLAPALATALGPTPSTPVDVGARLPAELRIATQTVLQARRALALQGDSASNAAGDGGHRLVDATSVDELGAHLDPSVLDQVVLPRLRARRVDRAPLVSSALSGLDRRTLVAEAISSAVADPDQPFVADTALRTAPALHNLIATHLAHAPTASWLDAALEALATVTPLRPFLRWDPVPSPAVVATERFTEGESLRVLVVRSGVTQDLDTLAITVTPPAAYAAGVDAAFPVLDLRYGPHSSRHLAPPKTSQVQAELHGAFDDAIGSPDPSAHQRLLGVALRENGTLFDLDIADITNPPSRIPQPNVRLEHGPGTPHADPVTLPLVGPADPDNPGRGPQPAPGQYVVHAVDDLVLPYLPDVLAHGVSLVFEDAGRDRSIPFPFGTEGVTAAYLGLWPEVEPFRLDLVGADVLGGLIEGRVIKMGLPAGDTQRFRLASSLDPTRLDWFGPWHSLPPLVHDDPTVAEAAADGWLWGLTPYEDVRLVHAVPRPLEAPRPTVVAPLRDEGDTKVVLVGAVDLHGPSTERLTAHASWIDSIDDITLPRPEPRTTVAVAFTSPVLEYEDLAMLHEVEQDIVKSGLPKLHVHAAVHEIGDTHHHEVRYRLRASTRFREYFRPDLLAAPPAPPPPDPPDPTLPVDDGQSVLGPLFTVSVPSSARPATPIVHSVIPLFRWSDGTEPEQPMARRHGRRTGLRIYIERPWYSSGDGELLGVLLSPTGDDHIGSPPPDQSGFPFFSTWAGDPVWLSAPVDRRPLRTVQLDDLLRTSGFDDRAEPGRPVAAPKVLPLTALPESPRATVLGYRPQYNGDRQLWYVDVAFDPGPTFWPFVRLAVCRYQPDSIDGCHLSVPVRCDFVQLPPERTTSVSRTDDRHVRVVVSGPIGVRGSASGQSGASYSAAGRAGDAFAAAVGQNRVVIANLQERDPSIPTDLGWNTVDTHHLEIRGRGATPYEAAWVGELAADQPVTLARPGDNPDWRVTVEEWERLPGDPISPLDSPLAAAPIVQWEHRLIYADEVNL